MRRQSFRPRPIDNFKKLPVVRSEDELVFEDEDGTVRRVSKHDTVTITGVRSRCPRRPAPCAGGKAVFAARGLWG